MFNSRLQRPRRKGREDGQFYNWQVFCTFSVLTKLWTRVTLESYVYSYLHGRRRERAVAWRRFRALARNTNHYSRIDNRAHFYPTMLSSRIRRNFQKTNDRCLSYPAIFPGECRVQFSRPNSTLKTDAKPNTLFHYGDVARVFRDVCVPALLPGRPAQYGLGSS